MRLYSVLAELHPVEQRFPCIIIHYNTYLVGMWHFDGTWDNDQEIVATDRLLDEIWYV